MSVRLAGVDQGPLLRGTAKRFLGPLLKRWSSYWFEELNGESWARWLPPMMGEVIGHHLNGTDHWIILDNGKKVLFGDWWLESINGLELLKHRHKL